MQSLVNDLSELSRDKARTIVDGMAANAKKLRLGLEQGDIPTCMTIIEEMLKK